jgi:hypothetical protein
MILDDLFNFAAGKQSTDTPVVSVEATVTTNYTGGYQTQTNTGSLHKALLLNYSPESEGNVGTPPIVRQFPADFSGSGLTITAPRITIGGTDTYTVEWQGNSFAANVDATTSIVYGAAGQQFITISLCNAVAVSRLA